MNNKEKYAKFSASEPIPVFSQSWWLNAVCLPENWDVILVEEKEEVIASFPYYIKKKGGLKALTMPGMTQKMGPYIKYPAGMSEYERLTFEKKVYQNIISQLPSCDWFKVGFNHIYTNWLPFYWAGFRQTTYYTYQIQDISDPEKVFEDFERAKKKNVRKALKEVTVFWDLSCEEFYENHAMTLAKQHQEISYSKVFFQRIYEAAYLHNQGRTIYARDADGNMHGALFVIWDGYSAYDLISTIDPDFRNSGAATLLVYEMIKYLSDKCKVFDFEGSMMEGVENSFRQFGTVQVPYFHVEKMMSRRMRLVDALRSFGYALHP